MIAQPQAKASLNFFVARQVYIVRGNVFGPHAVNVRGEGLEGRKIEHKDFAEILNAVAERKDREAFSELYRHYAPKVRAFSMGMGVGSTSADEIVQDVMLAVWRRASTYNPARAAVSTWIYAIARNRVIDGVRRQKRSEIDPNDPAFEKSENPNTEHRIDAERRASQLRAALKELPSEQAEILRISYFEGKSQRDISEMLNLPLGTVKSRTRLGLGRLRQAMGNAS